MPDFRTRIDAAAAVCGTAIPALLLLLAAPAAQATTGGGCVISPENPTAVLGLLGGGVAAWRAWRKRR